VGQCGGDESAEHALLAQDAEQEPGHPVGAEHWIAGGRPALGPSVRLRVSTIRSE
jgi:hypothetical protein